MKTHLGVGILCGLATAVFFIRGPDTIFGFAVLGLLAGSISGFRGGFLEKKFPEQRNRLLFQTGFLSIIIVLLFMVFIYWLLTLIMSGPG